ncbi:hypothetical protein PG993_013658 [Apiospora rasikravindrae]|uniref:Uncharacterized protein n=1 Tax=Apiospora rasikravindrae TaxID=990691 RepID=A0ABR1RR71_9PEZI
MDMLTFFLNADIQATFDAITNSAVQFETLLLQRLPGLQVETTFRAFPPAALLPFQPEMKYFVRIIAFFWILVVVPLDMICLAGEWNLVLDKGPRFKDYVLPQANNVPNLLLNFLVLLARNWLFLAIMGSFLIQPEHDGEEAHRRGRSWWKVAIGFARVGSMVFILIGVLFVNIILGSR